MLLDKVLTATEKKHLLENRNKCPFVSLVGGIGYICNYDSEGQKTPIFTSRNKAVKCEGCPRMLFVNPTIHFNGDIVLMHKCTAIINEINKRNHGKAK